MRIRNLLARGVVCALACSTVPVLAQEHGQEMDAETAKMMEMWMKLAAPGQHHAHLEPMAGEWKQELSWQMSPDQPEMTSTSASNAEWVLGGRFLMTTVKGPGMFGSPQPFEGLGIFGYDNGAKKYTYMWCDNMGTMMMISEGGCSEDGRTITLTGSYDDPASGSKKTLKTVYEVQSNDRHTMKMYDRTPEGEEFLTMTIVNTRTGPAKSPSGT